MSIPIPIFDRNQSNRLEAQQRIYQARDQRMAVELQLRTELTRIYESLLAAERETQTLRDEVLPGAQKAFELTNRGYQLGKFSFLEMLDAQRVFFRVYRGRIVAFCSLGNLRKRWYARFDLMLFVARTPATCPCGAGVPEAFRLVY